MSEAAETRPLRFEEAFTDLEAVVRDLEGGDISLEDALARYETGVARLKRCYEVLRDAEQKVLLLTGEDADGKPQSRPFEVPPAAAESPSHGRSRRTS